MGQIWRAIVLTSALASGCSDSPACVSGYREGYSAALTLAGECPFQGRKLLDALDHPEVDPDRRGACARARSADVMRDPLDAADHDCNVRAMLLREQIADACP